MMKIIRDSSFFVSPEAVSVCERCECKAATILIIPGRVFIALAVQIVGFKRARKFFGHACKP
ncbi:MAG: hypothetical protein R6W72_13115 [Desulfurivibrionaceae bacterium]